MTLMRKQWPSVAEDGGTINMGIYRRGKTWYMSYSVEGVRHRVSTYTSNKSLALLIYAKWMYANDKCYNDTAQTAMVRSPKKGRCK